MIFGKFVMNKMAWKHWSALFVLIVLNFLLVSDYLYHGSKSANFDAIAHITTIAQFHRALSDGEFPVGWGDGFANYGLPLGTIAHQIPAYLGGALTFLTHDPLMSFNMLYVVSAIVSAVLMYVFLTRFVSPESSLLGSIFYSLAPYRIMNLYMRGAMPEFFSAVWVPLFLIAIHSIVRASKHYIGWYLMLTVVTAGLILTHPMMLVVYAPIVGIWFMLSIRANLLVWIKVVFAGILAVALSAYYFLPLTIETKYLYYGSMQSQYARNQTTTLDTFINPFWKYNCVYRNDIFGRCQLTKGGVTETITLLSFTALMASLYVYRKKGVWKKSVLLEHFNRWFTDGKRETLALFVIFGAMTSLTLSTSLFEPVYERVRFLGNIQYPWRYLSSYLFFPPIALALLFEYVRRFRFSTAVWYGLIIFIVLARFPQLYAKNYTQVSIESYYFTPYNLHSLVMNTIWSGDSRDYPVRRDKAEIIEGEGRIVQRDIKNARRIYRINAQSDVRISDNTFYFPGWEVYVDGAPVNIEFQDPYYRGVITFQVPIGDHFVAVVYKDTKVRLLGKIISAGALVLFIVLAAWFIRTSGASRRS